MVNEGKDVVSHLSLKLLLRAAIVTGVIHPIRPDLSRIVPALHTSKPLQDSVRNGDLAKEISPLRDHNEPRLLLLDNADVTPLPE